MTEKIKVKTLIFRRKWIKINHQFIAAVPKTFPALSMEPIHKIRAWTEIINNIKFNRQTLKSKSHLPASYRDKFTVRLALKLGMLKNHKHISKKLIITPLKPKSRSTQRSPADLRRFSFIFLKCNYIILLCIRSFWAHAFNWGTRKKQL